MKADILIIGSGLAGLVFAERACSMLNKTCIIIEKRDHIGGNSYDEYDNNGVLIHKYGPHYFRTNSLKVKDYLTEFTKWRKVDYEILSCVNDKLYNFPINLNTFEQFIGRDSTTEEFKNYINKNKIPIKKPQNSEEVIISQVGWELYEMFFKGYTMKQWKRHPKDLDASVCGRIPIRTNRNNKYLNESFQAIPLEGYTNMMNNMITKCGAKLNIILNTDYKSIIDKIDYSYMVYTGPIDYFFNYKYGQLPYRSLKFEKEQYTADDLKRLSINNNGAFYQKAMQINYPNEYEFTRIVEVKHVTGQNIPHTTIVKEYPDDYTIEKVPYYPIPAPDSKSIHDKYKKLSLNIKNTAFIGRLATYKYYNMDQVIAMSLSKFKNLYNDKKI